MNLFSDALHKDYYVDVSVDPFSCQGGLLILLLSSRDKVERLWSCGRSEPVASSNVGRGVSIKQVWQLSQAMWTECLDRSSGRGHTGKGCLLGLTGMEGGIAQG